MESTTYLMQIKDYFYGYNNPVLLHIDLLRAKEEGNSVELILKRSDNKFVLIYYPITEKEFCKEIEQ